jgi:hypothetical protein
MLTDVMTLTVGLVLILVSVQIFLDKNRRQVVSEMFKATTIGIAGLFLIYVWSGASKSGFNAGAAPMPFRPPGF